MKKTRALELLSNKAAVLPGLSDFMLTAQAPGAQVEPLRLTIQDDCDRMNIGNPAPIGMTLGMAHIMTKLG